MNKEIKIGQVMLFNFSGDNSEIFATGSIKPKVYPVNGERVIVAACSLLHKNHYYLEGFGMVLPVHKKALKPLYIDDAEDLLRIITIKYKN